MDTFFPDESSSREENEGSQISCTMDDLNRQDQCEYNKRPSWNNFQFIEAMAVIDRILKMKSGKCSNCDAKNPKITKPSLDGFIWYVSFHHIGVVSAFFSFPLKMILLDEY
ncbi:hypothetical protein FXO37_33663, partial [Capsicum annuum]